MYEDKGTGVAVSLGFLALCGLSAIHGYGATARCEQVKALNAMCITGDEAACRTLRPGWTPPMRLPAAPAIPAPAPAPAPAPTPQ